MEWRWFWCLWGNALHVCGSIDCIYVFHVPKSKTALSDEGSARLVRRHVNSLSENRRIWFWTVVLIWSFNCVFTHQEASRLTLWSSYLPDYIPVISVKSTFKISIGCKIMLVIQMWFHLSWALIRDWRVVILQCFPDMVAKDKYIFWTAILNITATNESDSSL